MIRIASLIFFLLLFMVELVAATIETALYINSGELETVDGQNHPYLAYNETDVFRKTNSKLIFEQGDSIKIWIFNRDSNQHGLKIDEYSVEQVIQAGDSVLVSVNLEFSGVFAFYDHISFPNNKSLGLSGMLVVKNHNYSSFYWNIKEIEANWLDSLTNGVAVDWSNYYPDYFMINGNSHPEINQDSHARIVGGIGDTLIINILNSGQGIHSLHFHGYHCKILFSSKSPSHVGRSKDTFPIYPMESLILRLIPDKLGEYPVHDHNLVATTGGNIYPRGMLTTILISE